MFDNSNPGSNAASNSAFDSASWQSEWIDELWGQLQAGTFDGIGNVVVSDDIAQTEAQILADLDATVGLPSVLTQAAFDQGAIAQAAATAGNSAGSTASAPLPFSIRAEGHVTVNGNSDFDGDPLLPDDDALIYGGLGFTLNAQPVLPVQRDTAGNPILDEQGRPILVENAVAVSAAYNQANAPNNQYGGLIPPQIVETQTVEVPAHDDYVAAVLAEQLPAGVTPLDLDAYAQPLYNEQTWNENFPPGGTAEVPTVIRITSWGLNIPDQVDIENTILLVDNGYVNFNGTGHQLNNVTIVAYNGGINLSDIEGHNLTVMGSEYTNINNGSIFSGNSLIVSEKSVVFNGTTSALSRLNRKLEDSLE